MWPHSAQTFQVAKGDTIDFAVGYGSNGTFAFDSTATDLTVVFKRFA